MIAHKLAAWVLLAIDRVAFRGGLGDLLTQVEHSVQRFCFLTDDRGRTGLLEAVDVALIAATDQNRRLPIDFPHRTDDTARYFVSRYGDHHQVAAIRVGSLQDCRIAGISGDDAKALLGKGVKVDRAEIDEHDLDTYGFQTGSDLATDRPHSNHERMLDGTVAISRVFHIAFRLGALCSSTAGRF